MVQMETDMSDDPQKTNVDGRGLDNLTEVLRLQAETLARISERMAGMPPPQSPAAGALKALPPRDAGGESYGLPVLAGDPSLSEESLPVLNAFRKFIDAERRRARIRLIWATFGFAVLLTVVLGAVLYLAHAKAEDMQADIRAARQQASEARASADAEGRKLAEAALTLKHDVSYNLNVASSNVVARMQSRDAEVERLRETISNLEMDNAELLGKLKSVVEKTEQLQGAYEAQAQQMQALNDAVQPASLLAPPPVPSAPTNRPVPYTVISPAPQVQFRLPAVP